MNKLIGDNFDKHFGDCLGDRIDIINSIKDILNKNETELFKFLTSEYTSFYGEDEEEELSESCGLQIFIEGRTSEVNNYKYYIMDIKLSNKSDDLLITIEFNFLSSKKTICVSDIKNMELQLQMFFERKEYSSIINKLKSVLY